jgi:hypothetical protein
MRSDLTTEETDQLLDDADEAWPDSDFVASVREWFEDKGFITDGQETALNNIINRSRN